MNLLLLFFCAIAITGCADMPSSSDVQDEIRSRLMDELTQSTRDLDEIIARDTLVALTRYNAHNYFIYRGSPMGYEYDLLRLFADHLGVHLRMRTTPSRDSLWTLLEQGEGDVIADNIILNMQIQRRFSTSIPHNTTRQVLIQRKPLQWRQLRRHEMESRMIRSLPQLAGKTVVVPRNSPQEQRLKHLIEETGIPLEIHRVSSDMEVEQLIQLVNDGIIDYTVSKEHVARINAGFYRNIDIATPLSFEQQIGWVFRTTSPNLTKAADQWMRQIKFGGSPTYNLIYNKYYRSVREYSRRRRSDHFFLETGQISPYDSLFRAHETERFPWKLLAAIAYQESGFNPHAVSRFNATGLMQVLPETGKLFDIFDLKVPERSILAGVKYLEYLYRTHWSHLPQDEALLFTLASYNAGPGHVLDAQRLAQRFDYDPNTWFGNVEKTILKLSLQQYIHMEEVRHGYARGIEPKMYVQQIMERYDQYTKMYGKSDFRREKILEHFGDPRTERSPNFQIE
ncbi:transglycosylase SLT domain-containing protein [Chitinivibrio alkaliphilus]|uniref:Membrane-bound lytic murein transglycosylase F n=1 Tax=Chitinivibrio alkaliphilus ACht1 TaxID=1313304 RepID=U7D9Q6_9BACT|nr:transporter substrate-binding domain-containing protein [Chitinivibrio alkaliphilus]ERP38757.1 membrane-bound lytic murein transglycosylase F [Chitinivibrio alkaliphilus ACht1]